MQSLERAAIQLRLPERTAARAAAAHPSPSTCMLPPSSTMFTDTYGSLSTSHTCGRGAEGARRVSYQQLNCSRCRGRAWWLRARTLRRKAQTRCDGNGRRRHKWSPARHPAPTSAASPLLQPAPRTDAATTFLVCRRRKRRTQEHVPACVCTAHKPDRSAPSPSWPPACPARSFRTGPPNR